MVTNDSLPNGSIISYIVTSLSSVCMPTARHVDVDSSDIASYVHAFIWTSVTTCNIRSR